MFPPAATSDDAVLGAPAPVQGLIAPSGRTGDPEALVTLLQELGLPAERAHQALADAEQRRERVEKVLLASGELSAQDAARVTAERHGLALVDLNVLKPDLAAVALLGSERARRYGAVPIAFDAAGELLVAVADPANILVLDDLRLALDRPIRPVVATAEDVQAVIGDATDLVGDFTTGVEDEDEEEVLDVRETNEDAPVVRLVSSILAQSVSEGASDVHLEFDGKELKVRFRVDGVLADRTRVPGKMAAGVVSRIKVMADLDISERRVPQDGRIAMKVEGGGVDVRVVTLPVIGGEGVVMRVLRTEQALKALPDLGMRPVPQEQFETAFRKPYGAVLVTGPTGSGKSTTLYAALNALKSPEKNIVTIEDPVEYRLGGINQLQVNAKAGLTFASGLRAVLRADPDVIMVGEIRDGETAKTAVESALTGHLVLSTLHTNDAPSAITRLTEMDVEPFLTASALDCVVAQRLARLLCVHCKELSVLTQKALEAAGMRTGVELEVYEPTGCARCGFSGYRGRVGVYEVMTVTDEIRELTVERASANEIRAAAVRQGMRVLRDDGLDKVRLGLTSFAEVARVT